MTWINPTLPWTISSEYVSSRILMKRNARPPDLIARYRPIISGAFHVVWLLSIIGSLCVTANSSSPSASLRSFGIIATPMSILAVTSAGCYQLISPTIKT